MKTLLPWDPSDPDKKYIRSESTDIRKTFKAIRAKRLRELERKRRHEIAQMKGKRK